MIYLIGGAPRVGKSILCGQLAAKLRVGWISTDVLVDLLRAKQEVGVKTEWNASPEYVILAANWFFPYLDRFIWGVSSMAEGYVIEGVDFLPGQVKQLSSRYPIAAVFLGCSQMTLETLDQFPGGSPGYTGLPETLRRQIAHDVPIWSEFIRKEAEKFGYPYIDMVDDFHQSLVEAESRLTAGSGGIMRNRDM
jgi:hypothetical protein